MSEPAVERWALACGRHRGALLAGWLIALAGVALLLTRLPFDNSLETMLPEGSRAQAMIRHLREAGLAEMVVVTLTADAGAAPAGDLLRRGAAAVAGWVAPPLITGQVTPGAGAAGEAGWSVEALVPYLFDEAQETRLRRLADDPAALREHLRGLFRRQLTPQSWYAVGDLRRDPLGLQEALLRRSLELSSALGFRVRYQDGLLLDESGRRALLLLRTGAAVTDGRAARALVETLDRRCADLPAGLTAEYVCAHRHTVSNETLLKRDIAITGVAEAAIFFLLLVTCFRDPRAALLIFLVPLAAALLALPITAGLTGPLSYLVIGLGAVIAGLSVDYGIHAFVAARQRQDGARGAAHAAGPVTRGMLTVAALFAAFAFSSIAGYRQLAAFAIGSLVFALLLALSVLPHWLARGRALTLPVRVGLPVARPGRDRCAVAAWGLFLLAAALASRWVGFDGSLTALDGLTPEVRRAEQHLDETWRAGAARQAIIAWSADEVERALDLGDDVAARLRAAGLDTGLVSLADFWPGPAARAGHLARWRAFWSGAAGQALLSRLATEAPPAGFAATAFAPFAEAVGRTPELPDPATHPLLGPLWSRLVQERGGRWHMFAQVPDDAARLAEIERALAPLAGVRVISTPTIERALSETFSSEIGRITVQALLAVVAATFLLVRHGRLALTALIPPVSGVAGLLIVMALTGLRANVVNLMAGIVVFGLSMDYSYTMMHGLRSGSEGSSRLVVHLSALTTIVGAGVLLLARHPALFSIGVTLTLGVVCGYLSALFIIPAVTRLWRLHEH